jgi:nitrous oxidase accessory protein NosD
MFLSRLPSKLVVPILALAALPALAVDGQVPIPSTTIYATPITIGAPGSYVVARNLMPTAAGPIISVAVPFFPGGDVQIDLNGFVLDNSINPGFPVIDIVVAGSSEVTIRNGTLIGGSSGIQSLGPSRKVVVEDVKVSDYTAAGPGLAGIYLLDALNVAIRRCVVIDKLGAAPGAPGAGIWLDGGITREAVITDNLIRRTNDGILVMAAAGVEVSNNRIHEIVPGIFGAGIGVFGGESALVSQNTVNLMFGPAPSTGIRLNPCLGCKFYNNLVSNVAEYGIMVDGASSSNLVLNNVVRAAAFDGLFVAGVGNHIDRNVLNANGTSGAGFGLHFVLGAFDNNYGRNTGRGNAGGACAFFVNADFCDDGGFPPGPPNFSFTDNLIGTVAPF